MSDVADATYLQRPFIDLLSDAVPLAGVSHLESAPLDLRNAAAKASLVHSVFSLECAANCCLASLDYSSADGPQQAFVTEHRDILQKAKERMSIPFAFLDLDRQFDAYVTSSPLSKPATSA